MNAEKALKEKVDNPDFLAVSGSRLYGTNREGSDYDYRGFTIPPYEYLLGLASNFKDTEVPGADHKVYSMKRFIELLLAGDPQCTELLFVDKDKIIKITDVGQSLLDVREHVVSNKIYRRVMGFGYSEYRKAMGVKWEIEGRTKSEDGVVLDIRNVFKPDKDSMDGVLEILMKDKPVKVVPSTKTLGAKRKKEFEDFGFGVSSAVHAIRLTKQVTELMTTGTMTFPRPEADVLKAIRTGKVEKSEVEKIFEQSRGDAEAARDNSQLPDAPDGKLVWEMYKRVVIQSLGNDDRFDRSYNRYNESHAS